MNGITKLFLVATLALSILACGSISSSDYTPANGITASTSIDPALLPFKTRFEKLAFDLYGQTYDSSNLTMKFGTIEDEDTIAVCNLYYYGQYSQVNVTRCEIIVNPDYWGSSAEAKDNFMIHELGHCLNFRAHDSTQVSFVAEGKNGPSSIMYPNPIAMMMGYGPGFYTRNIEYYVSELFNSNTYGSIFNNGNSGNSVEVENLIHTFAITKNGCQEFIEEDFDEEISE